MSKSSDPLKTGSFPPPWPEGEIEILEIPGIKILGIETPGTIGTIGTILAWPDGAITILAGLTRRLKNLLLLNSI